LLIYIQCTFSPSWMCVLDYLRYNNFPKNVFFSHSYFSILLYINVLWQNSLLWHTYSHVHVINWNNNENTVLLCLFMLMILFNKHVNVIVVFFFLIIHVLVHITCLLCLCEIVSSIRTIYQCFYYLKALLLKVMVETCQLSQLRSLNN